ncbi:MAG: hypothetical protein R3F24_09245 [Gammaproteobacteria bacterium]
MAIGAEAGVPVVSEDSAAGAVAAVDAGVDGEEQALSIRMSS